MTRDAGPVEEELFAGGEPGSGDTEALLAQYRLFVETSEALVLRRQRVNTFFLSVNSIILAAAGLLLREDQSGVLESGVLFGLGFAGMVLCLVWHRLIASFLQLSRGKFEVIHALERRLPARVFAAEWVALGSGEDPKKYISPARAEASTPYVFLALQFLLACGAGLHGLNMFDG